MYHKSEITTYGTFSCTFKFPTYGTFLYGCTHILSEWWFTTLQHFLLCCSTKTKLNATGPKTFVSSRIVDGANHMSKCTNVFCKYKTVNILFSSLRGRQLLNCLALRATVNILFSSLRGRQLLNCLALRATVNILFSSLRGRQLLNCLALRATVNINQIRIFN